MSRHETNITPSQIKSLFRYSYYEYIPLNYIKYVNIRYDSDTVKRYNRAQISNRIDEMNQQYVKLFKLYNDDDISEMQIELRFDKLANDVNHKITSWYETVIMELKSED